MRKTGLNVLSLFNGLGSIWLALDNLGIKINKRYSSEIDKYSNQINNKNYPDTIQLGDVTTLYTKELSKIDLLTGGSPCQGFSFAGKGLNFEDTRSKLFFEFVRIKNELKPKFFLFENVKMKKEYQNIISACLGVQPLEINSTRFSAQNRKRLYWTNIKAVQNGLFGELLPNIPQVKTKNISIRDILQEEFEIAGKYYIKNKRAALIVGSCSLQNDKYGYNISKINKNGYKKNNQNKSSCLTAGGNSGGNHSDMDIICINPRTQTRQTYQQDRIYSKNGKSPALTACHSDMIVSNESILRRYTPIECERLQTIPDNYTKGVSDTQRYKMLGNAWTVDVISHILSFM